MSREDKATPPHECETPVDGSIQHRWKCKKCGQVWEVVGFDNSGNSVYEEVEGRK